MGHKWVRESINDETKKTMLYSATLRKNFDGGWNTWLGYYYEKNTVPYSPMRIRTCPRKSSGGWARDWAPMTG